MNNVVKAVLVALGVSFLIGALIPNVIAAGLTAIGISGIAPQEAIAAVTLVICLIAAAVTAVKSKDDPSGKSPKGDKKDSNQPKPQGQQQAPKGNGSN